MKYFKTDDNYLIKYNVIIDEENLNKIKEELIKKCSIISHINYITDNPPLIKNMLNYKERNLGNNEYEISYIQISYDTLVYIIDGLLKGISENIEYLFNPRKKDTRDKDLIIENIKRININIQKCFNIEDLTKYKLKLKELQKEMAFIEERNEKHELALQYIPYILSCINFKEIKRYSLQDIKNYIDFLDLENIDIKKLNMHR